MAESKPDYETRLSDAVEFYRQNPDAKYAPVARRFEVSPETLRRRVNGGRPAKGKPATHSKLSKAEEEALSDYVDCLNKLQLPNFREHVTDAANSIIKDRSSKLDTQPQTVGINWTTRFLTRHNIAREKAYSEHNVKSAFKKAGIVPLNSQVVIEGFDQRPRTPERQPESSPASTPLRLHDVYRASNRVIDSLKQLGATDDVVQEAGKLQDLYLHREALNTQLTARLEAEQRRKTQSQNDKLLSRRRLQLGGVLSIGDARHMRMHELEDDVERAERTAERARKRARRLDEQRSRQEQNQARWAAREQENADN